MKLIRRKFLQAKIDSIEEKKKKTQADLTALAKLKKELAPIADFLAQAKQQRDAMLSEIGIVSQIHSDLLEASMEHDLTKCVVIVDFTKWGLVVDGNVHCFVVCVLYRNKDEKTKKSKEEYCSMSINVIFYLSFS